MKPVSDYFAAVNMRSQILKLLIKKLEAMDSGYVSNFSLKQRRQLIKEIKEIAWLFDTTNKPFKFSFKWLLYFAMTVFFCFLIASI